MSTNVYLFDARKHTARTEAGPRVKINSDSPIASSGIEDGSLVTFAAKVLREAKYSLPAVMSRAVYDDAVRWDRPSLPDLGGMYDEDTRTWDILWMAKPAAAETKNRPGQRFGFELSRMPNRNGDGSLSQQTQYEPITLTVETMAYDNSGAPCLLFTQLGGTPR